MSDKLLKLREAAAYIGVAPDTLRKYSNAGEIKGVRLGKRWKFHQEVLDQWRNAGLPPKKESVRGSSHHRRLRLSTRP